LPGRFPAIMLESRLWLSAAYYAPCGLFLLDGERSRPLGSDLDLLFLAFRHGIVQPQDPRMLDPRFYTTQVAYVDFSQPLGPITNRQQLLSSRWSRHSPRLDSVASRWRSSNRWRVRPRHKPRPQPLPVQFA